MTREHTPTDPWCRPARPAGRCRRGLVIFGTEDARRVTQPVLAVVGERSDPIHRQRMDVLLSWLPKAEPFVLPGATHLLHLENARGMAERLAALFARHPLPAST